jgi:parallel beta-helix repeat protein
MADDGLTENNFVHNNTIINSEDGIGAVRSQDNVLESNSLSNIESADYLLVGGSSIIIREQHFDDAIISQAGSGTSSHVEIVDSGIIEVRDGAIDEEEDDGESAESEEEAEEFEGDTYNTNIEPYRRTLSGGDDITVSSS